MTAQTRTWRVGMVGLTAAGLFLLERLSLDPEIRLVGAFDPDSARGALAAELGCPLWKSGADLVFDDIDCLFLMDDPSVEVISLALDRGKHVVIDRPWLLSAENLRGLAGRAVAANVFASAACLRRGSTEFRNASIASQTGRLGALHSIRLSACEQALPASTRRVGVVRELGFDWLDQLLRLVESAPQRVFAKRCFHPGEQHEHGFLAVIEFDSGCTAQIEVETQTRLSVRTGWMLEGATGSYRGGRLYTVTPDGEIVDEPLSHRAVPDNPRITELLSAWRGEQSSLPRLNDIARVIQLIDAIEQSADTRQTVEI